MDGLQIAFLIAVSAFVVGFISYMVGSMNGFAEGKDMMEKQAIAHRCGRYAIRDNEMKFEWGNGQ